MQNEENDFQELRSYIRQKGLDCDFYRDSYIERRIQIRIRKNRKNSYGDYLAFLKKNPDEFQELIDCLAVNITSFFRDVVPYQILSETIFPLLASKMVEEQRRAIYVWSAACSTGEEPYSIAITARESISVRLNAGLGCRITASDIDEQALKTAVIGEYNEKSVENLDEKILRRYFSEKGEKYAVKDSVKNMITFKKINLIKDPPLTAMDLIFCRNMLIYIQMASQETIFEKFYRSLNPGGYLVIGKTEILPPVFQNKFSAVNLGEKIYRKEGS